MIFMWTAFGAVREEGEQVQYKEMIQLQTATDGRGGGKLEEINMDRSRGYC